MKALWEYLCDEWRYQVVSAPHRIKRLRHNLRFHRWWHRCTEPDWIEAVPWSVDNSNGILVGKPMQTILVARPCKCGVAQIRKDKWTGGREYGTVTGDFLKKWPVLQGKP